MPGHHPFNYALIGAIGVFIIYSLFLPGNRDITMPDNVMTFDTSWYEHERLRFDWALPQWNPFSGLGRIAVQWNQVPVSIFTPILLFTELTPALFAIINLTAIVLSLAGLYVSTRVLGYRSYFALIPSLIFLPGFYNPHNHPLPFATFFCFFPAALTMVIRAIEARDEEFSQWWFLAMLALSLSFVGIRLENLLHALVLLVIMMACGAGVMRGIPHQSYSRRLVIMSASLLLVIAASAWQIAYVAEATLDSGRVTPWGGETSNVFNATSWKWMIAHVFHRPELLVVLGNIAFLALPSRRLLQEISTGGRAGAVIIWQFIFVFCIAWVAHYVSPSVLTPSVFSGGNLSCTVYGFIAVALATLVLIASSNPQPRARIPLMCIGVFAGIYVTEYSDSFGLFMQPLLHVLIPLGALSATLAGRGWIVAALFLFHFFGEVGAIILYDVSGVAWLPTRAAFVEIPLRIALFLEGMIFLCGGISNVLRQWNPLLRAPNDYVLATTTCAILVLHIPGYANWPPISGIPQTPSGLIDAQVRAAYDRSRTARDSTDSDRQQRLQISGHHDFMPSYSQKLNTAGVYASELPDLFKHMFSPSFQTSTLMPVRIHPETGYALRNHVLEIKGPLTLPYPIDVSVIIDKNTALSMELAAAQGSKTPRAFMSYRVRQFQNNVEEIQELQHRIAEGGSLVDAITTSDPHFHPTSFTPTKNALLPSVQFVSDHPEHLVLRVDTETNGYLALMDMWSRGWRAYVDGQQEPIYRGYVGARIVSVPAGTHRVEFRYAIPNLAIATNVSIVGWVLILLLAARATVQFQGNRIPLTGR